MDTHWILQCSKGSQNLAIRDSSDSFIDTVILKLYISIDQMLDKVE